MRLFLLQMDDLRGGRRWHESTVTARYEHHKSVAWLAHLSGHIHCVLARYVEANHHIHLPAWPG